jgi:lysine 6-dehydrogenase
MKKALIAGMGIQGVAIAHGMHVLGFDVIGLEASQKNIDSAKATLEKLKTPSQLINGDITRDFVIAEYEPDVVISALPFHLNYDLALICIDNGLRYCDLGGNIGTANRICEAAEDHATVPCMTDLGLAPGMANNVAELGYIALGGADSVYIRVGGLPVNPKGTLKYGMTFNPQGLFNEYRDDCIVLKNGEKVVVEPLVDFEEIYFEELGSLVAFNTSGGIANLLDSMQERGVKDCNYKTIRFPGHVELIRFMLFECKMDQKTFSDAILNSCGFITDDQVLMQITVKHGNKTWEKKSRILFDENFTAMQKTTGFGAAAVAAILGSGAMDGKKYANYVDVPSEIFRKNMNTLIPELGL